MFLLTEAGLPYYIHSCLVKNTITVHYIRSHVRKKIAQTVQPCIYGAKSDCDLQNETGDDGKQRRQRKVITTNVPRTLRTTEERTVAYRRHSLDGYVMSAVKFLVYTITPT